MTDVLNCPQCGASDYLSEDKDRFVCNRCGTRFSIAGVVPVSDGSGLGLENLDKKQARNILLGVVLVGAIFGYTIYTSNKTAGNTTAVPVDQETTLANAEISENAPKYTEITQSFQAVPGKAKPEIWLVKRRNSSDLKEVDYRFSVIDPINGQELYTKPIISTMTWDQSFEKNYQVGKFKLLGSRVWIIIGGKELIGYDIQSRQKTMENQLLMAQFHQFADGIFRAEDLNNINGFKITSAEGFNYYYLPEDNRVLTEVEYDNVRRSENTNNSSWEFHTQYVFSQGSPQQLYKLVRRHQNLRIRKIYPEEVQNLLNDESLWYRKMYNVVLMEEFTPGKQYYNGNILYNDEEFCVFLSTVEAKENSKLQVQCLDKNRNLKWIVPKDDLETFRPFLKIPNVEAFLKNDQLVVQIPHLLAVSVSMKTGKVLWKYKLKKAVS